MNLFEMVATIDKMPPTFHNEREGLFVEKGAYTTNLESVAPDIYCTNTQTMGNVKMIKDL